MLLLIVDTAPLCCGSALLNRRREGRNDIILSTTTETALRRCEGFNEEFYSGIVEDWTRSSGHCVVKIRLGDHLLCYSLLSPPCSAALRLTQFLRSHVWVNGFTSPVSLQPEDPLAIIGASIIISWYLPRRWSTSQLSAFQLLVSSQVSFLREQPRTNILFLSTRAAMGEEKVLRQLGKIRGKAASKNEPSMNGLSQAPKGYCNKTLSLLLAMMLALSLYQQTLSTAGLYGKSNDDDDFDLPGNEKEDEASSIIRRSYAMSYAHILPCDEDRPSGKECMQKTLDYFNTPDPNDTLPSVPWWFLTLLRDVRNNGSYGYWHHFYTTTPPFNFCTIGKVATTEWRRVFCQLNADDCKDPDSCGRKKCAWRTKKEMPEDAPWAVFLRDPLER